MFLSIYIKYRNCRTKYIKSFKFLIYYYYYYYSALGPVWAEPRTLSGDWYGSGMLHPRQVLRGSLPLLSPAFLDIPTFATRCLHERSSTLPLDDRSR